MGKMTPEGLLSDFWKGNKKSCSGLLMLKRILSAIYREDVSFVLQQGEVES